MAHLMSEVRRYRSLTDAAGGLLPLLARRGSSPPATSSCHYTPCKRRALGCVFPPGDLNRRRSSDFRHSRDWVSPGAATRRKREGTVFGFLLCAFTLSGIHAARGVLDERRGCGPDDGLLRAP